MRPLLLTVLSGAVLAHAQQPQFFMNGHLDVLNEVDVETISEHYVALARRYQKEIEAQVAAIGRWHVARKRVEQHRQMNSTCRGQVGFVEASMLYIMPKGKWGKYKDGGQSKLLSDAAAAIRARYPSTTVKIDRLVVQVLYSNFRIEAQPVAWRGACV